MVFDNQRLNDFVQFFTRLFAVACFVLVFSFSARAEFNTVYFSINGDTTLTTLTQGDEFGWGSNCEIGASIYWEIWFDVNSNSTIESNVDVLISSELMTDGNLMYDFNPIPDGSIYQGTFFLALAPGNYIFEATDLDTDSSISNICTIQALSSPPNQFTGQLILPGITPPNALLENRLVIAESETGDEGFFGAKTDANGNFTMNITSEGTGVEFFIWGQNIPGYVPSDFISAVASGVVANNDLTYQTPVDSVYGYIVDESLSLIPYESDITAESNMLDKSATSIDGRYVIYFTEADKGDWIIGSDSRNSPRYVTPQQESFSHDTLGSFQHDITLYTADTAIYAKITENGALPVNNYRVDANSSLLNNAYAESVSGTGSNNVVRIGVSSLEMFSWNVQVATWDEDFPIPAGYIADPGYYNSVAPGDTVEFNFVNGYLISGTITQDPEDAPIDWNDVYIGVGEYGGNASFDGSYEIYTNLGMQYLSPYVNGYISSPAWREVNVSGDTSGSGLDFVINETHCTVTGTLLNVTLPLNSSFYTVYARTGTDGSDGYIAYGQVDSTTGTYILNLCDGDWTIEPPCCFTGGETSSPVDVTIGESPDNARTIDFDYGGAGCCVSPVGDVNGSGNDVSDISDLLYLVDFMFKPGYPTPPCIEEANIDGLNGNVPDISDLLYLVDYMFFPGSPAPVDCQ